jgi:hypothetical protein
MLEAQCYEEVEMKRVALAAVMVSFSIVHSASAADCVDVLTKSQLKASDFTSHEFYMQHEIWSSTSEKNDSEEITGSAVVYGVPMTVGDKKNAQSKFSQFRDTVTKLVRDQHLVLYNLKAESEAIKQWGKCMNNSAGVRARFVPQTDDPYETYISLVIEYATDKFFTGGQQVPLYLTSDAINTIPPSVTFLDDNQLVCLRKGHKFEVGDDSCKIDMFIPSGSTSFPITLKLSNRPKNGTRNTRAEAFLPERLVLGHKLRDWPRRRVAFEDRAKCNSDPGTACVTAATYSSGVKSDSRISEADDGYIFLTKTISCTTATGGTAPNGYCSAKPVPQSLRN